MTAPLLRPRSAARRRMSRSSGRWPVVQAGRMRTARVLARLAVLPPPLESLPNLLVALQAPRPLKAHRLIAHHGHSAAPPRVSLVESAEAASANPRHVDFGSSSYVPDPPLPACRRALRRPPRSPNRDTGEASPRRNRPPSPRRGDSSSRPSQRLVPYPPCRAAPPLSPTRLRRCAPLRNSREQLGPAFRLPHQFQSAALCSGLFDPAFFASIGKEA